VGKIAVQTEGDFPKKEISDGIGSVPVEQHVRFHYVAHGLGHLASFDGPPPVSKYSCRRGKPLSPEHGRPVYSVGRQNVLSDEMGAVCPERRELFIVNRIAGRGNIVDESIKPDVSNIFCVKRDLDPPMKSAFRPADAEVFQGFAEKSQHLVAPRLGPDKISIIFNMLDEPILILAHFKEVIALLDLNDLPAAIGAFPIGKVLFSPEAFIGNSVPA
jgi:hypothetical protein